MDRFKHDFFGIGFFLLTILKFVHANSLAEKTLNVELQKISSNRILKTEKAYRQ